MKHGRTPLFRPVQLFVLAAALSLTAAHADEYSEVSQLMHAGKLSEAQARVDRHLAAKPRDPQMRFMKGVIQRDAGRLADALITFTKLTEDFPELPEPYNNLAVIHASLGQNEKARAALEMALRTNPSYATAHENLGDVYAKLASQAYNKALQIDGSNTAAQQPKLALIRELFNPAAAGQRAPSVQAAVTPPTPSMAVPPVKPPVPVAPTPAAVKPAVTATAAPAPAPPAAATPQAAAAEGPAKEVESAVHAWAKAWANKNMAGYLGAYSQEFTPPGQLSRSVWEQERRLRITGKARISVSLLNLSVTITGNRAVAKFQQDYKADSLAVLSRKTLELVKTGDRWMIVKETSGA
jgi:tetratricopeptide (TPR) repeat protein